MIYKITSPGTCGEFIQGYLNNQQILISCPINKFTIGIVNTNINRYSNEALLKNLNTKSLMAYYKTKEYYNILDSKIKIPSLYSTLLEEKGMGSSTADITTVIASVVLQTKNIPNYDDIAKIATIIEPTNSSFYNSAQLFNYIKGSSLENLGEIPKMKILIFDTNNLVNTEEFNNRIDLQKLYKINEANTEEALYWFKKGIKNKDYSLIGKASTISAFTHQKILYKPELEKLIHISQKLNAFGIITAHSGSLIGLLFPYSFNKIKKSVNYVKYNLPNINFIGHVNTYSGGLKYEKF